MTMKAVLLAGAACLAALPARADDSAAILKRLDALQQTIAAQQKEIEAQKGEISELRSAIAKPQALAPTAPTAMSTTSPETESKLEQVVSRVDADEAAAQQAKKAAPLFSFVNGRPTVQSPDGRFSLALRLLGQFDTAYYMQGSYARRLPVGPDFSSGANFRRAQIGFQGTLFGDWSYLFNTEFGGSGGTESGGRVQALYVQYDGWKPLTVRLGAYPPPGGLDDNTSAADTLFLERAAASDIMRNAVGGDGRDAATVTYASDRHYAALSLTGGKVGGAANFDDQQALLGRLAETVWESGEGRFVLSASGAWLFRPEDESAAAASIRDVTLSSAPELTVDSQGTKLVSTGAIDTRSLAIWGVEAGGTWRSLYAQGGYFDYALDRAHTTLPDLNFDGWYAQTSWVITGEHRGYNAGNAAFTSPKPAGGWGVWELAARYSVVDLNDDAGGVGLTTPYGGVRGGKQSIWAFGVNWYPDPVLRFELEYERITADRLGTLPAFGSDPAIPNAQIGQTLNALALRTQLAL